MIRAVTAIALGTIFILLARVIERAYGAEYDRIRGKPGRMPEQDERSYWIAVGEILPARWLLRPGGLLLVILGLAILVSEALS